MTLLRSLFALVWVVVVVAAFNRGGGPLASHVVLTGLTFLAVVFVAFRHVIPAWRSTSFKLRFMWIHGIYSLFCVLVAASIVFGLTPEYGLSELLLFMNTGILLFLFSGLKATEDDVRFFAQGTLIIASLISAVGFWFYVSNPIPRLAGTFLYPSEPQNAAFNSFANFLLVLLPLVYWYAAQPFKKRWHTYVVVALAGVLTGALVLTFSRAAYLSFVAVWFGYGCALVIMKKKKNETGAYRALVRMCSILLISAICFVSLQAIRARYFDTTSLGEKLLFQSDEGSSSALERVDYWHAAVALTEKKPLLGTGVLSFRFLYPPYQYTFGINEDHPHNLFLKIGVENGAIAMILFVFFVLSVAYLTVRLLARDRYSVGVFLMLGVAAAFLHNLIDFNFIVSNFTLLMALVGIFFALTTDMDSVEIKGSQAIITIVFFLSLGLAALVFHEAYYNRDLKAARNLVSALKLAEAKPHLDNAAQLIFKRDYFKVVSDFNRAQYMLTGNRQWLIAEGAVLPERLAHITPDADYFERMGEGLFMQPATHASDIEAAGAAFCQALRADPRNSLREYYFYAENRIEAAAFNERLISREELIQAPTRCGALPLDALLQEYSDVLKNNKHFTILTENPSYASRLYELIGTPQEKADFDGLWRVQARQYSLLFGPLPAAISPDLILKQSSL